MPFNRASSKAGECSASGAAVCASLLGEQSVHPEALEASLLDADDLDRSFALLFSFGFQARKKLEQRSAVTTRDGVLRHLLTTRRKRGHEPRRAAQLQ